MGSAHEPDVGYASLDGDDLEKWADHRYFYIIGSYRVGGKMPEYVEPAVRELRDQESEGIEDILLGVSGDRDEYIQRLRSIDAEIEDLEKVGRASIRFSAPAPAISAICALEGTKSIELDRSDVETYTPSGDDQGNS